MKNKRKKKRKKKRRKSKMLSKLSYDNVYKISLYSQFYVLLWVVNNKNYYFYWIFFLLMFLLFYGKNFLFIENNKSAIIYDKILILKSIDNIDDQVNFTNPATSIFWTFS